MDESRRPAGTEDLLVGHEHHDDESRFGDDEDRVDERSDVVATEREDEYGTEVPQQQDRLDTDRMDQDRDQLDRDQLDRDQLDREQLDQDRLDDSQLDRDRLDDESRLDGREGFGDRPDDRTDGTDRTQDEEIAGDERGYDRAYDQADENRTLGNEGMMEGSVDGELGDMGTQYQPLQQVDHAAPSDNQDYSEATSLFTGDQVEGLRGRWVELQAAFVDDPRTAVQLADQLVAEVMQTLAQMFSSNKQELEGQWQREGAADTEDLRQALRRYRSFFDQLLRA